LFNVNRVGERQKQGNLWFFGRPYPLLLSLAKGGQVAFMKGVTTNLLWNRNHIRCTIVPHTRHSRRYPFPVYEFEGSRWWICNLALRQFNRFEEAVEQVQCVWCLTLFAH